MVDSESACLHGTNRGFHVTPLFRCLNKRVPERFAIILMIAIYASIIFCLAFTLGYEYRSPVLYLDAR